MRLFFAAIKGRLENDIAPYIELVRKEWDENHRGIGNFALVRMLAPIIETTAKALDMSSQDLLHELGLDYPYLYWSLFRDVFSHNDEFQYAKVIDQNGKEIIIYPGLGVSMRGTPSLHTTLHPYVTLSLTGLYDELTKFLDRKMNEPDKKIRMAIAIQYLPGYEGEHKAELTRIIDEIKAFDATRKLPASL